MIQKLIDIGWVILWCAAVCVCSYERNGNMFPENYRKNSSESGQHRI